MTNGNDNVIPFPGIYKDHPPQTMEEVAEHLDFFRFTHIQDSLEMIVPALFNQISVLGYNNFPEDDPVVERLGAMIIESIRSYLCYHHEILTVFKTWRVICLPVIRTENFNLMDRYK